MMLAQLRRLFIMAVLLVAACTPRLTNPVNITAVTAVPTIDTSDVAELCRVGQASDADWAQRISALELLVERELSCGATAPETALYNAYLGYGTQMESEGRSDVARRMYEAALNLIPTEPEARERLLRMEAGNIPPTELPEEICDETATAANTDQITAYHATDGSFIKLDGNAFTLDGEIFPVYGINYFPRDTPFRHFLTETTIDAVATELSVLRGAGINTVRIFLYYADLFTCPSANALPIAENFNRLDQIITILAEYGFHAIVVLNHDPDLTRKPLYTNPEYVQAQTRFIVQRYLHEPTVLAWDVRDRGDLDYRQGGFTREEVLTWLAETVVMIRALDPNHLITAGWWQDASATAPLVDFVSFQFYGEYADLRQEIANLRAAINKPILLTSIGYSTFAIDEIAQRNLLYQAFEEIKHNNLLGWVVYMAFDFPRTATCTPPDCPGEGNAMDHYGIWNTSYFPKLAVDAVEIMTGVQQ